jgi:hypothetical protein
MMAENGPSENIGEGTVGIGFPSQKIFTVPTNPVPDKVIMEKPDTGLKVRVAGARTCE